MSKDRTKAGATPKAPQNQRIKLVNKETRRGLRTPSGKVVNK